ncbi:uncharacterized protein LTR77_009473 [Saxophila tyrrhenica]|uniref:Thioredoxin domain-containing protein n=1 Tax=Saxophila tyrrhenica TaxID=1690608 RepID=A0AAV9NXR5_9PEZI|nr:hypothetical protein LTR77_009473 [Saxophila tyrrhenica]
MSNLMDKVKGKVEGDKSSGGSTGPLKQGSKLPSVGMLKENHPVEANMDLGTLSGKNIIVSVPGAFSPTCSDQVPGYLENAEKFAAHGVKGIYVVAVNDQFTVDAWKSKLGGAKSPLVHFIADDEGKFTKAAGMDFDSVAFFGNRRSKRYAAIVEDGVVKSIWTEDDPTKVTVTSATNVLQALG